MRTEIDELWALHRAAMARMDRAEKQWAAADKAWRERADRVDARMDKFDHQLQTTRKLVEAGMKIVSRLAADTRELKRSQKAFLDSLANGSNGHRRNR